jgi:predicted dehydrogenase
MSAHDPVRLALIGAGNRGADVYAGWCLDHPDEGGVVAVADPDPVRRRSVGDRHGIADERRHDDWRTLIDDLADVDGVIVATPDRSHVEPAEAVLAADRDLLLEKPIAATAEGVRRVAAAADASAATVTVAHVLRYTPFFATVKRLLDEGAIGRLAGIQHTENIGFWHFAHSYVRGPWRRAGTASPMILAKASHDFDILRWLAGTRCETVACSGALTHFRSGHRPEGAPDYCLDGCPAADDCPFHAGRLYLDELADRDGWPMNHLTDDRSPGARAAAVARGPFGRCVYACDNDVADHYSAVLGFAGGVSATLTVSAFTRDTTRTLKLMGSRGELRGHLDAGEIELRRFLPRTEGPAGPDDTGVHHTDVISVEALDAGAADDVLGLRIGHAGGDAGLMADFVRRLRRRQAGLSVEAALTDLDESLESHFMALAAEQARLRETVVHLDRPITDETTAITTPRSTT